MSKNFAFLSKHKVELVSVIGIITIFVGIFALAQWLWPNKCSENCVCVGKCECKPHEKCVCIQENSYSHQVKYNKNIYKSPYVLLFIEKNNSWGSGCIVNYKKHSFIITATHLFLNHERDKLLEDSFCRVFDPMGNYIGLAKPVILDNDYDITVLFCDLETYLDLYRPPLELKPTTHEELVSIVGEQGVIFGANLVGDWVEKPVPCMPFVTQVTISRVVKGKIQRLLKITNGEGDDRNELGDVDVVWVTVKGDIWYGCSGGPLVYNGKVIAIASMLENYSPKTGGIYISVADFIKKHLENWP